MKITQDAAFFGAWGGKLFANRYVTDKQDWAKKQCINLLDIGTGSGILPLMVAQQFETVLKSPERLSITGIDIDKLAAEQAQSNFVNSPFSSQLSAVHSDIQSLPGREQWDAIISNPPFFENSLENPDPQKKQARHTDQLSFEDLVKAIVRHLSPTGMAVILLPIQESESFLAQLKASNYSHDLMLVGTSYIAVNPDNGPHRAMQVFAKSKDVTMPKRDNVCYYESQQISPSNPENLSAKWTQSSKLLMDPFYLQMIDR